MLANLRKNLSNLPGWTTPSKIVVIESDDWGSIRTRSGKDYFAMLSSGLEVDASVFTMTDCLESNNDLEKLFELLYRHKDSYGKHSVLTAMCIMANPDFEKIREANFAVYFYENFTETCRRYPDHDRVLDLWRTGIKERLFSPAFHGREHLNVSRWLKILQSGHAGLLKAFEHQSIGATFYGGIELPDYLGAFHPDHHSDINDLEKIIITGSELFNSNCGYLPTHFIAPNRESAKPLDKTLFLNGVKYQTISKIRRYSLGDERYKTEFNWLGRKNEEGQVMLTRNCVFDPVSNHNKDWVDSCMKEIEVSFKWHKPAIINSHRVNYVGQINSRNSELGLKELDRLLTKILKKWPDIEFLTSTELGDRISEKY